MVMSRTRAQEVSIQAVSPELMSLKCAKPAGSGVAGGEAVAEVEALTGAGGAAAVDTGETAAGGFEVSEMGAVGGDARLGEAWVSEVDAAAGASGSESCAVDAEEKARADAAMITERNETGFMGLLWNEARRQATRWHCCNGA